jgi:hypothetical protein
MVSLLARDLTSLCVRLAVGAPFPPNIAVLMCSLRLTKLRVVSPLARQLHMLRTQHDRMRSGYTRSDVQVNRAALHYCGNLRYESLQTYSSTSMVCIKLSSIAQETAPVVLPDARDTLNSSYHLPLEAFTSRDRQASNEDANKMG